MTMTPIISGEFWFEGKMLEFTAMIENGELRMYIIYNDLLYDLRFFFANFIFLGRVYAFKKYYNSLFLEHISKVLDGTETEYVFKYFDAMIHMKIEKESVENNMMLSKITELNLLYDEVEETYMLEATVGNKIWKKNGNDIEMVYDQIQLILGYYEDSKDLKNIPEFIGKYINLAAGYKITLLSPGTAECMKVQPKKTIENLMNSGLVKITNSGFIDLEAKNKLLVKLKEKLGDIIRENLIEELVEY